jgi:hypothetical protein
MGALRASSELVLVPPRKWEIPTKLSGSVLCMRLGLLIVVSTFAVPVVVSSIELPFVELLLRSPGQLARPLAARVCDTAATVVRK